MQKYLQIAIAVPTFESNSFTNDDGRKIQQWYLDAYRACVDICAAIGIACPQWITRAITDIHSELSQPAKQATNF